MSNHIELKWIKVLTIRSNSTNDSSHLRYQYV